MGHFARFGNNNPRVLRTLECSGHAPSDFWQDQVQRRPEIIDLNSALHQAVGTNGLARAVPNG